MKKEFTKEYMTSNRGCYSREKMLNVKCVKEDNITLENLFNDLPIRDFCWFLVRKCELTLLEKRDFAIHCAKQVLPIYEKQYPNDSRVRECIEATELFISGDITADVLRGKRHAVAVAYADAAAYAADADAATDAAYAAAYAYKKSIWEFIKTI